ncbi:MULTISPECIES: argininosuccinate synthase domain-containing protein [unclassified Sulfurimonas]|uniref:argininosuccinate synthase domain-containing protein n=1 Tax=unclassified Sulfurimonas TaxID=2623549 RepID=UPI0008B73934|nr:MULTISPECIES: argininosuccinate synthase domain-containing protein [unclassified Sulfurimonas]MDD3854438.1 7-cyano-7-deazaguanine synthase [Sulfurimonas sp.]MDO8261103.1 7-cyano-7-deazaguanine synthase [Candidatus Magasanikbacteria bacterium]OHE04681.1 MAG: ATP-binding protein [Sulfurimonas sp. RIFOXYB12_FULL_35_9]OHE12425.1 MAG: ATP-binding protein [Sulfurimonas sp. RIFOXYC2_FULL_36_7]
MKAIALFSGGLDSTLAMKLIIDQGIEVLAVNINTGFGSTKDRLEHMQSMCDQVGAELKIIDIESEFLQDVLFDPKHGYGKNFNPCIDCHAKMFAVAKRVMEAEGASFLVSGEVLGQRPMSQNRESLQTVLNESNCNGLLLRPLSAKALEPTIAEINGWVDREKLENITGRNRERQLELVKEIGLDNFESPGGGCLLTDENFAKKMFDFIKHDTFEVRDIKLMKFGRHLRLKDGAKLVIGRNQDENSHLQNIENDKYYHIKTPGLPGPHSMLSKSATQADKELAAKIILTYCKTKEGVSYTLTFDKDELQATPFASRDEIKPYTIM